MSKYRVVEKRKNNGNVYYITELNLAENIWVDTGSPSGCTPNEAVSNLKQQLAYKKYSRVIKEFEL